MILSRKGFPKSRRLYRRQEYTSGLTLVEVMIALVLTGLILAAVYNLFSSQESTQVLVDQLSEMNQNLRIAANSILMDMRSAGYHVEGGIAISGEGQVNAIEVTDGGSGPDSVTVLYAVPGFETRGSKVQVFDPSSVEPRFIIEDCCPPVAGATVRSCTSSSPTCFCEGDLVIVTDGRTTRLTSIGEDDCPSDGPGTLPLDLEGEWRVFKAARRTYRVEGGILKVTDEQGQKDLVEGIEDLQITPTSSNNASYQVAITARTRKQVPGSGYRRRTITETVRVRNLD